MRRPLASSVAIFKMPPRRPRHDETRRELKTCERCTRGFTRPIGSKVRECTTCLALPPLQQEERDMSVSLSYIVKLIRSSEPELLATPAPPVVSPIRHRKPVIDPWKPAYPGDDPARCFTRF